MGYGDGPCEFFGQPATARIDSFKCGLCGRQYVDVEDPDIGDGLTPIDDPAHWYVMFAGVIVAQCCLRRLENSIANQMPVILVWLREDLAASAESLDHLSQLLLGQDPTPRLHPPRPDLFQLIGRFGPDTALCEICGLTSHGNDDVRITAVNLGDIQVVDCCFTKVQASVLHWAPAFVPWYSQRLQGAAAQVANLRRAVQSVLRQLDL